MYRFYLSACSFTTQPNTLALAVQHCSICTNPLSKLVCVRVCVPVRGWLQSKECIIQNVANICLLGRQATSGALLLAATMRPLDCQGVCEKNAVFESKTTHVPAASLK